MALSAPGTPRQTFSTPIRKVGTVRTPLRRPPNPPNTPRTTPKQRATTPKYIQSTASTPECFSAVSLDTPAPKRTSRDNHNKFDQVSNLTVAVRIRPMNSRELACVGAADVVRVVRNQELILRSNPCGNSAMSLDHIFQYDHVFWSCDETSALYSSQEDVFLTMGKPLLNSAFRGYNACLFAYGQTGSGKSFSMMGKNNCEIADIDSEDYSGITPRFCRDLFNRISKLSADCTASVEVSYFEIYNEKIHDLLANSTTTSKMPLKVREHPIWGPYVVDLTLHTVKSYTELRNWLLLGNKNRATAATTMNEKSSRSHSIFSIELSLSDGLKEGDSSRRSKVSLVDLAGSERLSTTHNSDEKIRQGVSINKSLLTLGKVISALAEQKKNQQFVPYRDSVLTWLLRESLGGNSLTAMLATITPANNHLDETLATLRYACQARAIVNRARINENPHDRLIRELRTEVERLKALRQDYERNSFLSVSSSLTQVDDDSCSSKEELDGLRSKLGEAERKLNIAEKHWEQRFMESQQFQLKELIESEKRREELESKVRIMKTADNIVKLSPYKTNFLEELENVLTDGGQTNINNNCSDDEIIENIINWCGRRKDLNCTFNSNIFTITDCSTNRKSTFLLDDASTLKNYECFERFFKGLEWSDIEDKPVKKMNKTDVIVNMNQIYQILDGMKPLENDNNLSLMFAKVNKSLQSFETALLNNIAKNNGPKMVTFNL